MIRKLELLEAGEGEKEPLKSDSLLYDGPVIGIAMDRAVLYDRINKRVHRMIEAGLPEEVKKLLASGLSEKAQSLKGIGYKEMIPVVKGELSLEEGEALIQKNTRHFAKRQLTWYRRMPYIHWWNAAHQRKTYVQGNQGLCHFIFRRRNKMEGKMNLQDTFLNEARKENVPVSIFLMNGVQLKGKVKSFDSFTVLLVSENRSQLIYKHAISTIQRI